MRRSFGQKKGKRRLWLNIALKGVHTRGFNTNVVEKEHTKSNKFCYKNVTSIQVSLYGYLLTTREG